MCDFDDQTALGCIELFKECLTLLLSPSFSLKLESFLPVVSKYTEKIVKYEMKVLRQGMCEVAAKSSLFSFVSTKIFCLPTKDEKSGSDQSSQSDILILLSKLVP